LTKLAIRYIIIDIILLLEKIEMFYQSQHFGISEYFCKECGTDFSFPYHMHHSFEFISVLEGEMTVTVEDVSYELKAGEGVLIFPEQIHSLESTRSKHMLIIFSPDIVSAYYTKHSPEIPCNSKISVPEYLNDRLEELNGDSSIIKIKAVLYLLCSLLDENTKYIKKKNVKGDLLREVFDFVENNYDKECDLVRVSRELGYNSAYLSRFFSETTKTSFISYVNRYRISKACYALRNTNKTVLECAYECGFHSLRSFNRNFKSTVGVSPKEYRENR
jgi:AraC-like DNA-binding protein